MRSIFWTLVISAACWIGCSQGRTLEESMIEHENYEGGELWAVLVAGSNGWYNYRHQADVCHAYQILHKHGVPDDHIIVMMYDDISYNELNPYPGVIINRPNGSNVYEGVVKDYTGKDVTPENFLKVLKGNAEAMEGIGSGKVVNSTSQDRIFVNLVDHGGPGIFAFPDEYLHAMRFAKTIKSIHKQRKFREMVIYVEACESGSLFKNLLPDYIKVYALSASSPHQSSYACYMDDKLCTYLGDVFSIKWMEDTDRENIHQETLSRQFHLVKKEVTTSRVMQWGERDINREKLWKFMGERDESEINSIQGLRYETKHSQREVVGSIFSPKKAEETDEKHHEESSEGILDQEDAVGQIHEGMAERHKELSEIRRAMRSGQETKCVKREDPCISTAVASPDVPEAILSSRIERSTGDERAQWKRELSTLHMKRMLVRAVMMALAKDIAGSKEQEVKLTIDQERDITQWDCYERSVEVFHNKCFNIGKNPYVLRVMHIVVNICESGFTADKFEASVEKVCRFQQYTDIN